MEESLMEKVFSVRNIMDFFKEFPIMFLTIDTFYALLLVVCLFVLGSKMTHNNSFGIVLLFAIF